jgi:two-component system, chemotaxis family, sensor kinase CheA
MDLLEFKSQYIEEAHQLLTELDNSLIIMEKDPKSKDHIEQIFRVMHTLKGTSGMYGFDKITEISHELENIFNLVREDKISPDENLIEFTLNSVDHIRNLLRDEGFQEVTNIEKHALLLAKIEEILKKYDIQAEIKSTKPKFNINEIKKRTWQILLSPDDTIAKRGINFLSTIQELFKIGECKIETPNAEEEISHWTIYLVTDKNYEEIEDALIFIIDICKIHLIANFDIFDEESIAKNDQEIDELYKYSQTTLFNQQENIDFDKTDERKLSGNLGKSISNRFTVDASKLDTLMYLVSELVTTKSELQLNLQLCNIEKATETADKIDKLSKQFRDNALSLRLVSFQEMISRFNRLIHDLSKHLNKKIEFIVSGENTELDKNIIDTISDPIMHLIRNCIDHGIETTEEREISGKSEVGVVKFFAYKNGNFVFIQIGDDGKGIDNDKIRQKAIDLGIISESANLSDRELWNLIFAPGFSTAENLTQVSGRGVGMDVVKRKVEELRGEVTIDSEKGLGTTFTIKLQQTIAIIDTLLVSCDAIKIAIPLEDVENCELILATDLSKTVNKLIPYKNELIPYINLHKEFDIVAEEPEKYRSIIINKHDKYFAILTDNIIGEYQAVIKTLGNTFQEQYFVSGASILGDGSIALLLDTEKLKKLLIKNY